MLVLVDLKSHTLTTPLFIAEKKSRYSTAKNLTYPRFNKVGHYGELRVFNKPLVSTPTLGKESSKHTPVFIDFKEWEKIKFAPLQQNLAQETARKGLEKDLKVQLVGNGELFNAVMQYLQANSNGEKLRACVKHFLYFNPIAELVYFLLVKLINT